MTNEREPTDAIEACVPYDGPHTADKVVDTAHGLSALVRYMCNATQSGTSRRTLEWAATVHRILGGVSGAVYGLDQLFGQLAEAMERQAADPTLYDDRRDRPGRDAALELAEGLQQMRMLALQLGQQINDARELSVHLGND